MIKSNIGKYLELAGITQRELAERVGTTEVSISRYASGERIPKATTCIQIAKVLNCRAEDLFYEEWSDMAVSITENEAIIELQSYMPKDNGLNDKDIEAFNMAIHALSEIQQYREIGTVEEIKSFFNENRKAGYEHGYSDGYSKTLDVFCEKLCDAFCENSYNTTINGIENVDILTVDSLVEMVWDIAEELKGVQ